MDASDFLYFAYGSNMLIERLRARCPSVRLIGVASASGWRLTFDKQGDDGSGKAMLEPAPDRGGTVQGVVYRIDLADLASLDSAEGHPDHYERTAGFRVTAARTGEILDVVTYLPNPAKRRVGLIPYHWYHALVLAGALRNELPEPQIAALKRVRTMRDPDAEQDGHKIARAALEAAGYLHVL